MATGQRLQLLLLILLVFSLSGNGVHAFGAGNIPRYARDLSGCPVQSSIDNTYSYGHLKGKAFRHGDIVGMVVRTLDGGAEPRHRKRSWESYLNATV